VDYFPKVLNKCAQFRTKFAQDVYRAAEVTGLLNLSNYFHAVVSAELFLLANVQVDRKGNN
jgi:hypothetical protein